jgi:hypothetical protein
VGTRMPNTSLEFVPSRPKIVPDDFTISPPVVYWLIGAGAAVARGRSSNRSLKQA